MKNNLLRSVSLIGFLFLLVGAASYVYAAKSFETPDGSKVELPATCPVCEMKIESDSDVRGAIVFTDGKVVPFDKVSDFFRYLFAPDTFGFDPKNIKKTFVLDHDSRKLIEPKDAVFVLGPETVPMMGPEMEAFSNRADAEKFASGAKDKKILAFSQVSLQDVSPKKKMLKMKH
jgi:nitrous oxide reductase accessory protein NosL